MARVVFFNIPAYGHINPTLPVIKELAARNEEIFYYATDEFQNAIESTGTNFCSYDIAQLTDQNIIIEDVFQVSYSLLNVALQFLKNKLEEIKSKKPDYIIYDTMCPWGKYISKILDIPAICSIPIFITNNQMILYFGLNKIERYLQMANRNKQTRSKIFSLASQLQTNYNLKYTHELDLLTNHSDFNIVYTLRDFHPFDHIFKDCFKFVGPTINPSKIQIKTNFLQTIKKPIIYISMGTIFNKLPELYRACFDALKNTDYNVIISIGNKIKKSQLGEIPKNFIIKKSVPQLEILSHSSLFISHGGMNSVSEALYYKVPLITIPQALDQHLVSKRLEALKLGKVLNNDNLSPQDLRDAIDEIIINPVYKKECEKMGELFQKSNGHIRAIEEIDNFKQIHRIS